MQKQAVMSASLRLSDTGTTRRPGSQLTMSDTTRRPRRPIPPDAPSRTPSCAQNKNSISVLDIPSNTCGPLLVSDSKRVHILFTSVLNYISSNKTPCPDRNSVLDLIPWLVTPVFPRIGGRVVPIKHRMCYAQATCVTEQRKSMHGCPYRLGKTQGSGYPPLTHTGSYR